MVPASATRLGSVARDVNYMSEESDSTLESPQAPSEEHNSQTSSSAQISSPESPVWAPKCFAPKSITNQ